MPARLLPETPPRMVGDELGGSPAAFASPSLQDCEEAPAVSPQPAPPRPSSPPRSSPPPSAASFEGLVQDLVREHERVRAQLVEACAENVRLRSGCPSPPLVLAARTDVQPALAANPGSEMQANALTADELTLESDPFSLQTPELEVRRIATGFADTDDEEGAGLESKLLPIWTVSSGGCYQITGSRAVSIASRSTLASYPCEPEVEVDTFWIFKLMQPFMLNPSGKVAVTWDFATFLCLLFDLTLIPLSAYDLPAWTTSSALELTGILVWTCDLVLSFFRGYEVDGTVDMRPSAALRAYLRGWFSFDFFLITLDWALFIFDTGDYSGIMRLSRFRRVGKALRLLRLMRLIKHSMHLVAMFSILSSEDVVIGIKVFWLLAILIFINHFTSCTWYAVGTSGLSNESWVAEAFDDEVHDFAYRYFTAFHWSVTQFTPASMEVTPKNTVERIYNVVMIFIGLVAFSCFVSQITTSITSLTKMSYQRQQQKDALMRYMKEKHIPVRLRSEIVLWASSRSRAANKRVYQETDIAALKDLPYALLMPLRIEVHMPILEWHRLFAYLSYQEPEVIIRICVEAMTDGGSMAGEEIFRAGAKCTCMYFIARGSGKYSTSSSGDEVHFHVKPPHWLSEACLWVYWEHRGRLLTTEPFEYSVLETGAFQKIMSASVYLDNARRYARLYMKGAELEQNGAKTMTDMWGQWMHVFDLVHVCFEMDDRDNRGSLSGMMGLWTGSGLPLGHVFEAWKAWAQERRDERRAGVWGRLRRRARALLQSAAMLARRLRSPGAAEDPRRNANIPGRRISGRNNSLIYQT